MTTTLQAPLGTAPTAALHPLAGTDADFEPLLRMAARRRFVLIGEASHGTHEFYRVRAELTKRLIRDHGFRAVAIEGDWPDAHRVNRYVRGFADAVDAEDALRGFKRFPQWMWRNADVLDFVGWLRQFNETAEDHRIAGFYGLDLYSLHASIEAVVDYLRHVDPDAAMRAARGYACLARYGPDAQEYGYATEVRLLPDCEKPVLRALTELRVRATDYLRNDGRIAADDLFFAEQNARVVAGAEQYYRAMYRGSVDSWNLRDQHMADTLDALVEHLDAQWPGTRVVVWAHNSHLGDARATQMGRNGERNLGQLVRQARDDQALLVGFTTYDGSVTAATDWNAPAERKRVRPAREGSYEALFHDLGVPRFFLDLRADPGVRDALMPARYERAIGVIYRPETEFLSHYFRASLPAQFDALFHYDRTRAVEPLERTAAWEAGESEPPETWPTAL